MSVPVPPSTVFVASAPFTASFDGSEVILKFPFYNDVKPSEMGSDFSEIAITVFDNENKGNEPLSISVNTKELNEYLKDPDNLNATFYFKTFLPEFSGKTSSNLYITADVNYVSPTDDVQYPDFSLDIPVKPDQPVISLVSPLKFKLNSTGTGVEVDGDVQLKVASIPSNVTHYSVTVNGEEYVNSNKSNFTNRNKFSYAANLFPLSITSLFSTNIASDSDVYIRVQCEANNLSSKHSEKLSAKASIRLDAPTISAVTSMQDRKITVSGSMKQAPYLESTASSLPNKERIMRTILAVETTENEVVSEDLEWKVTDVINIPVKGISGGVNASQGDEPFTHEVTSVGGIDLKRAKAYRFVAVAHYGNYEDGKSINILSEDASRPAPALNQSPPSNMDKTGLCVEYLGSSVKFAYTQNYTQNSPLDNVLTFTPTFSGGQLPSPDDETVFLSYSFSSKLKGVINEGDMGTYSITAPSVPLSPFWNVSNPVIEDEYTLEAKVEVFIPTLEFNYIQGTPAINIAKNEKNFWVSTLKEFSVLANQTRPSSEVPGVMDLSLSSHKFGANGTKALVSSHKSHSKQYFQDKKFQFVQTEHEVIKGTKTTNPNDFHSSKLANLAPATADSAGSTRLTSSGNLNTNTLDSLNLDHAEDTLMFIYPATYNANNVHPLPVNQGDIYSTRARVVAVDVKSGVLVLGDWSYAFHEVGQPLMNAPANVQINNFPKGPGDGLTVSVSVDNQVNLNNKPAAWLTGSVIPLSFRVELSNHLNESVGSGPYSRAFTPDEVSIYKSITTAMASPLTVSLDITGLTLEENMHVYAKAFITYALESDTSKKSEGDCNNKNHTAFLVPPTMEVTDISLVQTPLLLDKQGPRAVDDTATSLTVYAVVDLKDLKPSSTTVQCYLKTANSPPLLANGPPIINFGPYPMTQDLDKDSTGNTWKTSPLVPNPQVNYLTEPILVQAINRGAKYPVASKTL